MKSTEKELPAFATFITECREKMCIRQRELADMIGSQYQIVSRWERGLNRPGYDSARKLGEVFNQPAHKFREK